MSSLLPSRAEQQLAAEQNTGIGVKDPPPQPIVVVVLQREQIEPVAGGYGVLEHADRRADVARPEAGEGNAAVVARREGFDVLVSRAAQPHQKNTFRAKSNAVWPVLSAAPPKMRVCSNR